MVENEIWNLIGGMFERGNIKKVFLIHILKLIFLKKLPFIIWKFLKMVTNGSSTAHSYTYCILHDGKLWRWFQSLLLIWQFLLFLVAVCWYLPYLASGASFSDSINTSCTAVLAALIMLLRTDLDNISDGSGRSAIGGRLMLVRLLKQIYT